MTIRFVTGTDTGVGKTVAAAALVRASVADGRSVIYFKPVQTGVGPAEPGDADFVRAAAEVTAVEGLRFPDPLAPAVAAEVAGEKVDADALATRALDLAAEVDDLVVEGAGGLLVPLSDSVDMAGFARMLGAELVVVARPTLGTLNHTALTLEAARARGFEPVLVIAGWPAEPDLTETTNRARLEAMAPLLGVVPAIPGLNVEAGACPEPPVLRPR
ncbi:MAG: dethiobiotin synthase [Actinobacteria bacterium]|nr:dethiobiotin synthase [Actinomycetota bacterium]